MGVYIHARDACRSRDRSVGSMGFHTRNTVPFHVLCSGRSRHLAAAANMPPGVVGFAVQQPQRTRATAACEVTRMTRGVSAIIDRE